MCKLQFASFKLPTQKMDTDLNRGYTGQMHVPVIHVRGPQGAPLYLGTGLSTVNSC